MTFLYNFTIRDVTSITDRSYCNIALQSAPRLVAGIDNVPMENAHKRLTNIAASQTGSVKEMKC